ncbi:MAG: hypothetical protein ABJA93_12820 [Sporichthyaceae bacterium]
MSYDIYFVRRDPGQTFADALDATEESYGGDPSPLGSAQLEQWERIIARARQILDGVEEFATDAKSREFSDAATGIQLSMIADEVSITVPSERPDQDPAALMAKIYALARVVEAETGLEGYDPQMQEPITDPSQQLADPLPPSTTSTTEPAPAQPSGGRRWWKFWKW